MKKGFTGLSISLVRLNYAVADSWESLRYAQRAAVYRILHESDFEDRRNARIAAILCKFQVRPLLACFFFWFGKSELIPALDALVNSFLAVDRRLDNHFAFVKLRSGLGSVNYYAPHGAGLSNLTYWEWVRAEEAFLSYFTKKDIFCLAQLAAILYRPMLPKGAAIVAKNGDTRQPFNDYQWPKSVDAFIKLDAGVLFGIFDFYSRARKSLISQFDLIFPPADESDTPVNREATVITWFNVLDSLADSKLTAYGEIEKMPVFTVFMNLSRRIQENNRLKDELEKSKAAR